MNRYLSLAVLAAILSPATSSASDFESYWYGFKRYWNSQFGTQDGVSMVVLGVLVLSIFIITRAKWSK